MQYNMVIFQVLEVILVEVSGITKSAATLLEGFIRMFTHNRLSRHMSFMQITIICLMTDIINFKYVFKVMFNIVSIKNCIVLIAKNAPFFIIAIYKIDNPQLQLICRKSINTLTFIQDSCSLLWNSCS